MALLDILHPKEDIVKDFLEDLAQRLEKIAPTSTEADLRREFHEALMNVLGKRGTDKLVIPQFEAPLASKVGIKTVHYGYKGRIDALYNTAIIEFKKLGRMLEDENARIEAIAQLVEYLTLLSSEKGEVKEEHLERLSGFATDGYILVRVVYRRKLGETVEPLKDIVVKLAKLRRQRKLKELRQLIADEVSWYFDIHTSTLFRVEYGRLKPTVEGLGAAKLLILAVESVAKIKLTPENFEAYFGTTGVARRAVPSLLKKLRESLEKHNYAVENMYLFWKNVYLGLAGYSIDQLVRKQHHRDLLEQWGIDTDIFKPMQKVAQALNDLSKPGLSFTYRNLVGQLNDILEQLKKTYSSEAVVALEKITSELDEIGSPKLEKLRKACKELTHTLNLPSMLLYALHTYYSILLKILAYELASLHQDAKIEPISPIQKLSFLTGDDLKEALKSIEEGGLLKIYGFTNLVEKDVYSWYLYVWDDEVEKRVIKPILNKLSLFNMATPVLEPKYVRDLLKKLYQRLLPKAIRHDLGEYYTPDWLAELVINEVNKVAKERGLKPIGDPDVRVLDPACGSGTFLVLTMHKIQERFNRKIQEALKQAMENGIPPQTIESEITKIGSEYLCKALNNVVGLDINPLAVLTAKINYLIALAPLLQYKSVANLWEITIPIYMTDSILAPSMEELSRGKGLRQKQRTLLEFLSLERRHSALIFELRLPSIKEEIVLEIPISIFKRIPNLELRKKVAEVIFNKMEQYLSLKEIPPADKYLNDLKQGIEEISKEHNIKIEFWDEEVEALKHTYDKIADLSKRNRNHVWCVILKQWISPLWLGEFDYVIGNPPWVQWESLPESYRRETQTLWNVYGLFTLSGMETILGGGKKDLSALMAYVAVDKFLKRNGIIGFLITQAVFKSVKAGEGFRKFIVNNIPVGLKIIHDLVEVRPFEGAQNRTTLFVAVKGEKTTYPVPYIKWIPKETIDPDYYLSTVLSKIIRKEKYAIPLGLREGAPLLDISNAEVVEKFVKAKPQYSAETGVCSGGLNAVYFLNIVQDRGRTVLVKNVTKGMHLGRLPADVVSDLKTKVWEIEKDLLYPLIRYGNVWKWYLYLEPPSERIYFLMVQDPVKRRGIDESVMKQKYPLTYNYLLGFKNVLERRSAYKRYYAGRAPFYSIFDVGTYTLAEYKVVFNRMGDELRCTIVEPIDDPYLGRKAILPENVLTFIPVSSTEEAYYLVAIINSTVFKAFILNIARGTKSFATPDLVNEVLRILGVPKYDPNDKLHRKLVELSVEAHKIAKDIVALIGDHEILRELLLEIVPVIEEKNSLNDIIKKLGYAPVTIIIKKVARGLKLLQKVKCVSLVQLKDDIVVSKFTEKGLRIRDLVGKLKEIEDEIDKTVISVIGLGEELLEDLRSELKELLLERISSGAEEG